MCYFAQIWNTNPVAQIRNKNTILYSYLFLISHIQSNVEFTENKIDFKFVFFSAIIVSQEAVIISN